MSEAFTWRPIDTAPDDATRILLSDGVRVEIGKWESWGRTGMWMVLSSDTGFEPTYWMPLPEAPKNSGPPA